MSPDPAADLARLRARCLALPGVAEKASHATAAFLIEKSKVFAYFTLNHHGDDRTAVLPKTSGTDEQQMLIEADAVLYYRPPYIGHSGWIGICTDRAQSDWGHLADRIETSWRLVAPRKLLEGRA